MSVETSSTPARSSARSAGDDASGHDGAAQTRFLSTALDLSGCATMITSASGTIVWVNRAFTALTGYTMPELAGQTPRILKSGAHDAAFYAKFWDVIAQGGEWRGEMINRRKDGTLYREEMVVTPSKDHAGNITHFIAAKHDITERHEATERVRAQAVLLEVTRDAISIRDLAGKVVYWNHAAEELYGWGAAEVLGKGADQLPFGVDNPALHNALSIATETGHWNGEIERSAKDGRVVVTQTRCTRINDPQDNGQRVLVVDSDITERVKIHTQFLRAQRMEAVGQLAGGVAHDFNNLLAVIRGHTELLLLRPASLTPQAVEHLTEITKAAERAANLTRQLLTFSRKQVLVPQRLQLNELISGFSKMLHRIIGEDIALECNCSQDLPEVMADAGMIEQVLMNLVVNARDAMPSGGELTLKTRHIALEGPQRQGSDARAGQFVCVSVSDTGMGIPDKYLSRIFEPFFTTKEIGKGTGLGLATAYGIAKQHQGWMDVKSAPGAGTTFTFYLPVAPAEPAAPKSSSKTAELKGGTETILLVEDEMPVRIVSRKVLEAFGYQVHEASSAREALEQWTDRIGEVDLLLTDIVLPCGVSGPELAQQLREKKPKLKIVFMSGYSQEKADKNVADCHLSNCEFLPKTGSTRALLETVRRCLDK